MRVSLTLKYHYSSTVSIESCSTPGKHLRHCGYHIWSGVFGTGPDYDFTWVLRP